MTEIVSERWDEANPIPDKWMLRPLGSLGQWLSGGTPSMKNEAYWGGGIPWVSPKDMKRPRLHDSINHVSELALSNGTKLAPRHALFVVVRGMILAHSFPVARTERAMAFNQDIKALVPHDHVDSDYLLWWLTANRNSFLAITTESTHGTKRLPTEALFAKEVLLPPLPEQRAIAAALSDVDALIERLDALIAKKRAVKTATMQRLLTGQQRLPGFSAPWTTKRLGEVFDLLQTANNSRKDLFDHGDIAYIHYGDIHTFTKSHLDVQRDRLPFIDAAKVQNAARLQNGDLVMVDASEDYEGVGKSIEVSGLNEHTAVAGLHTFLLRGDDTYLADGFKGYMQHMSDVKDGLHRIATGTSVYGISKTKIKDIDLRLPPVEEQKAIATILSDMDAETEALEARRDKTQALKQGMMQELLTGRTRLV